MGEESGCHRVSQFQFTGTFTEAQAASSSTEQEVVGYVAGLAAWGGNSSFKTCYDRTKTALVGLLRLVLKRFAGSKTHLNGKNISWLSV
jgi:hypothetical protein